VRGVDGADLRLLHRRSQFGYTRSTAEALALEPEAVDRETQARLTAEAHRRWTLEQARAWGTAHATIRQALHDFTHSGPVDRAVLSAAQAVERAAQRVDRRVGLS